LLLGHRQLSLGGGDVEAESLAVEIFDFAVRRRCVAVRRRSWPVTPIVRVLMFVWELFGEAGPDGELLDDDRLGAEGR
jgi:hypothetical protein